ncbi:MAG: MucB/RseB C-terminal domain-containing protein [Rubrivivax sp.]|nr:MucB/RseB C-terminal domain-containing protein [Rubrivivax sp.]
MEALLRRRRTEWTRRAWLPMLALASCLLPPVAGAAPDAGPDAAALPAAEARVWLTRIRSAASGANYQGTMVFSIGGTVSSSRVGHYAVGDQTYEHLEALDGRQQRILRHNDAVHTLWPQSRVAVIEKRETRAAWSTTPQQVDPQALELYDLRREGMARVAGRDAAVFILQPRDALRYPQRLWADEATGLVLRADVIGLSEGGTAAAPVLESTQFSEVAIGVKPRPEVVLQDLRNPRSLDGWRVVRPQQHRTELAAEGWVLQRPVAGFQLAACVRRGMETAGDQAPVLQVVFTDGLTHVSLFIEPYQAQRHRSELRAQQGATGTLMQRRGEYWVTVVGDVPVPALKLFAEALDRRRP